MASKYRYRVFINTFSSGNALFFSYGHTKLIELIVQKDKACIVANLGKNYSDNYVEQDCYLHNLIREGMKRVMLVHLLKYEKPIAIHSIALEIAKCEKVIYTANITDVFLLYSMIQEDFIRKIPDGWKDDRIIQSVLTYKKSKDTLAKEVASLYAYLYSKTKSYETERFSYLWIAMNGFYSSKSSQTQDRKQMRDLLVAMNLGNMTLTRKDRDKFGRLVTIGMMKMREPLTFESITHGVYSDYAGRLENLLCKIKYTEGGQLKLSAYGFFLLDYPYYLRCKYFHSGKPLELFSFDGDMELNAIALSNGLLEEFLDSHLIELFQRDENNANM